MNILVLGSGGREHAFTYQLAKSESCENLYTAPGNAGTGEISTNLPIDVNDFTEIKKAVLENNIGLVVVGPEDPLVKGISDYFKADPELAEVLIVGPSAEGAALEGSKERAKEFMADHNIPTAAYQSFTADTLEEGKKFLETMNAPYVLKADGLAAGKGVLILTDLGEAKSELENMLQHSKFGKASSKVVIEEFLDGIELSVFVLTDGQNYKILPTAKDYKRIGEGDTGLNTGGMGAISPVPFADDVFMNKVEQRIVKPTVNGLHLENIDYRGFVFIGLIKVNGDPFVIEYNVRMGDPETEAVLPRIQTDLVELMTATASGNLEDIDLVQDGRVATTVVVVSGGYPEGYEKGYAISGVDQIEDSIVFHAGTKMADGSLVTNGGRVMAITSLGDDIDQALARTYSNIDKLSFEKMYFRTDIGFDL